MNGQSETVLTGLIGSSPLGALAAFGLLRACSEISELSRARLSWRMEDDWVAVLSLSSNVDKEKLIKLLSERQKNRPLDMFEWSPDIRSTPTEFRNRLLSQVESARGCDRWRSDYYAAFGSEAVTDGSKGLVKPTAFHMTSGQQKFLKSVYDAGKSLRDNCRGAFEEALFGPWRYEDPSHSLGWDPTTERMYALRHRAPTSEPPRSVRAAVWFAVESLPLFPTAVSHRRLRTTGFQRREGDARLVWPIWTEPIAPDTLKSLLATSGLSRDGQHCEALGRRGVAAVFESIRSEFGQGYAVLRPSTLIWARE